LGNMDSLIKNRYRIVKHLGSGGFGDTFLAEDTDLPSKRPCVIKQLKPVNNNPQVYQGVKERFEREAVILEKLGEANSQIPTLYAYFEEQGQFYLVQEWIDGETLTEQAGKFSETQVKTILAECLSILENVHHQGIIHRDIKPDNIILRYHDDKPVLIDFGAVKETMGTTMTASGRQTSSIVIGTPGFMPSEQSIGRPVFSSDLYSLALTMIYLLTGKNPPEMPTDLATGEIQWRQDAPQVSPQFADVLDKAIATHPRDRFLSARAMLNALSGGVSSLPETTLSASPNPPPTRVQNSPPTSIPTIPLVAPQPAKSQEWQKSLVLGGVIGGLTLIGLVAAALILKNQPPTLTSQTPLPSPTTQSQTFNPTPTPIPPTPTPYSTPTPIPPTPTPYIPTPTPQPTVNKPSPEQTLINYYNAINRGDYGEAWNMLPSSLQNNPRVHPDGFQSFKSWFQKTTPITVNSVQQVRQSTNTALVKVRYRYVLNSRSRSMSLSYNLVWNSSQQRWLIESVRKN
jgi:serine/threonine-protein kinase